MYLFNAAESITRPIIIVDGGQIPIGEVHSLLSIHAGGTRRHLTLDEDPIDFICITTSPWPSAAQSPLALVVLYESKIEFYDIQAEAPVPIKLEHALDLHTSMTTAVQSVAHCDAVLFAALEWAQAKAGGLPKRPWCLQGGVPELLPRNDWTLVLTGHADGSVKFWHTSNGAFFVTSSRSHLKEVFQKRV